MEILLKYGQIKISDVKSDRKNASCVGGSTEIFPLFSIKTLTLSYIIISFINICLFIKSK